MGYCFYLTRAREWLFEEKYLLPILELADALGAEIQGEEFEVYTRESVLQGRKGE